MIGRNVSIYFTLEGLMAATAQLRTYAYIGACLGIGFHVYSAMFRTGGHLLILFMASLPYIACILIARFCPHTLMALIPIVPVAVLDVLTFYLAFIDVGRSTVSIALMTTPIINLVVVVPVGMFVGWVAFRWYGRHAL